MTREEALKQIREWDFLNDEEMAALETLIPELRESGDERIRKWLIEMVEELRKANPTNAEHNGNCSEAISYLEKQKENSTDKEYKSDIEELREVSLEIEKEWEDERIRNELIELVRETVNEPNRGGITVNKEEKYIAYLEKQKEPVVGKEGMYYYLGGKFIYCGYPATEENPYDFAISQQEKQKEQKELPLMNGDADMYFDEWRLQQDPPPTKGECFEEGIRYAQRLQKEQKSADLPAGFYVTLDGKKYYAKEMRCNGMTVKVVEPKQEWSEEDERNIRNLESVLYYAKDLPDETRTELGNFLKSLRPSWKPSEEQIYSLGTVVKGYDECTVGSVGYNLKEMYEQLKKLM